MKQVTITKDDGSRTVVLPWNATTKQALINAAESKGHSGLAFLRKLSRKGKAHTGIASVVLHDPIPVYPGHDIPGWDDE